MSCFIIGTSYKGNSVSNYFFAIGRELASNGHKVYLLINGKNKSVQNLDTNPAIIVWPSLKPTSWRDLFYFIKIVKKISPDVIIGNFVSVNIMIIAGWMCSVPNRIAWCHTLSSQLKQDSYNSKIHSMFLRCRKIFTYHFATKLIVNSTATLNDVVKTYKVQSEKCLVLPLLISSFKNKIEQKENLKIVCVGRMYPSKGQMTLIEAAIYVKNVFPQVSIEFIGDGPMKTDYQQSVKSLGLDGVCYFTNSLAIDEVLNRMASATICVVPSNNEAFGLVNIEAQSVGTPVISSRVGGIVETIIDKETGFLVSPGDPEELASKIILLLSDSNLRMKLGIRAIEHFSEKYSIENNIRNQAIFIEKEI